MDIIENSPENEGKRDVDVSKEVKETEAQRIQETSQRENMKRIYHIICYIADKRVATDLAYYFRRRQSCLSRS